MMRDQFIAEEDRSLPVQIPTDRPLTHGEQRLVWCDIVPEVLRRGRVIERRDFRSQEDYEREAEKLKAVLAGLHSRYGWLLNRLDWDRQYLDGVPVARRDQALADYGVPTCCDPGQPRALKRSMLKLRESWGEGHYAPVRDGWKRTALRMGAMEASR